MRIFDGSTKIRTLYLELRLSSLCILVFDLNHLRSYNSLHTLNLFGLLWSETQGLNEVS
jgi:hypothetical protein